MSRPERRWRSGERHTERRGKRLGERYGERGTTLSEVLVVAALLSIIALPVLGALQASTRHDERLDDELDAAGRLHRVQQLWLDDLRSGTLSLAAPRRVDGTHAVQLELGDERVRWTRTAAGLERRVEDTDSGAVLARVVLLGAADEGATLDPDDPRSTFGYRSALGAALDPSASDLLDRCARSVTLSLWVTDTPDPAFALTAAPRLPVPIDSEEDPCP